MFGVSRHLRVQRTSFAFGPAVLPPCSPSFVNGAPNAWDTGPGIFLHPLTSPNSPLPQFWTTLPPNGCSHAGLRGNYVPKLHVFWCVFSLIVLTVIVLTFWNKGAILPSYGCCSSFILDSRDHLKCSECMQTVCFCFV